tara:strand:+ start:725 stop:1417 length:693 start_codon:yes stop_codon:yes gene_type:complete
MAIDGKDTRVALEQSWLELLNQEFKEAYMQELSLFLKSEINEGKKIYPKGKEMFLSMNSTPFHKVKVVIIGQDPYHGPGQAHGLCFSVPKDVKIPPSLENIYKELEEDLGIPKSKNGCLLPWAGQGVLLLNSVLSVEKGRAGSHALKGWERFTDKIISKINEKDCVVFMLWGRYAVKKAISVDTSKHLILKSVHPSPLSAHKGFFGNRHFSKCNEFLNSKGMSSINWEIC